MERDTEKMRVEKPYVFTSLKKSVGASEIIDYII